MRTMCKVFFISVVACLAVAFEAHAAPLGQEVTPESPNLTPQSPNFKALAESIRRKVVASKGDVTAMKDKTPETDDPNPIGNLDKADSPVLMESGSLPAKLLKQLGSGKFPYPSELIAARKSGSEQDKSALDSAILVWKQKKEGEFGKMMKPIAELRRNVENMRDNPAVASNEPIPNGEKNPAGPLNEADQTADPKQIQGGPGSIGGSGDSPAIESDSLPNPASMLRRVAMGQLPDPSVFAAARKFGSEKSRAALDSALSKWKQKMADSASRGTTEQKPGDPTVASNFSPSAEQQSNGEISGYNPGSPIELLQKVANSPVSSGKDKSMVVVMPENWSPPETSDQSAPLGGYMRELAMKSIGNKALKEKVMKLGSPSKDRAGDSNLKGGSAVPVKELSQVNKAVDAGSKIRVDENTPAGLNKAAPKNPSLKKSSQSDSKGSSNISDSKKNRRVAKKKTDSSVP
ncbi:uncharacterized protein LOC132193457 [Neocloeon triangulifer]|uniref:uncharacterized protein LOC132193457 n=1 Tax=Neocloeon triangulifer TaxID=2078957 RepID=UPI00286F9FA7|nr:uncharacterized protein LOC132193457 [Neocloeon triangulifer]